MELRALLLYVLIVQHFRVTIVSGQLTSGLNGYRAKVFGVSRLHKNVLALISVTNNHKDNNNLTNIVKTSKRFTDPKNGWTLWIEGELNLPDENWPTVEEYESPEIKSAPNILHSQDQLTTTLPESLESSTNPNQAIQTLSASPIVQQTNDIECQKSITEYSCEKLCSGDLIFEENFDTLNWTIWHRELRIPMEINDGEFVSYQNRSENCYVNNGVLYIMPTLLSDVPGFDEPSIRTGTLDLGANCTGFLRSECYHEARYYKILPPIVSARIRTQRSFEFRFGRVEIRAKLPRGDWMFPLILLEPTENIYGSSSYSSGQMRVAFARGNDALQDIHGKDICGSHVLGGPVLSVGQTFRETWLSRKTGDEHLADDFHIYTLTWTDRYIALQIDGNEYSRISGNFVVLDRTHNLPNARLWRGGEYMAPFDRKFFITLGLAAGGHSDFPDGCMNPGNNYVKPWTNGDPKAALQFWKARANWVETWSGSDTGLHVDYVRVYAL